MRRFLAVLGTAALVMVTGPAVHATPVSVDGAVQSLTDSQTAYAKKGGWKHGGHGWGHHRGGPPPWAPAHGWRRKHGWGGPPPWASRGYYGAPYGRAPYYGYGPGRCGYSLC